MYIFNIPIIQTPHEYYHTTIIIYQSTYTSPQIHIITTFTEFHQCTYSPSHVFKYDTFYQIQVHAMFQTLLCACGTKFGFEDNYYRDSTNVINTTNYILHQKTQHDYECMDFQVKTRQCTIHQTILYNLHHHIIFSSKPPFALSSVYIHTINKL